MASRFTAITEDQMRPFLEGQGFSQMQIRGTVELVFGKLIRVDGCDNPISLRVQTAINPNGESRECGNDAIRVQLVYKDSNGKPVIGKTRKCLRTKGWRKNIQAAIDDNSLPENFEVCPKCGSPKVMRETADKSKKFFGCITWGKTKCPGYVTQSEIAQKPAKAVSTPPTAEQRSKPRVNPYRIPEELVSDYQRRIREIFLESDKHILMGALAGCGKTAMCLDLSSYRPDGELWQYIVFNNKNAVEGRSKFPRGIPVQTQHSFDAKWIRKLLPNMPKDMDRKKTWTILNKMYPHLNNKNRKRVRGAVMKMVGYAKAYACRPDDLDEIKLVMDKYDFELEPSEPTTVVELTGKVLKSSLPQNCGHAFNFDDLLWWPTVLDLEVPRLNVVMADECQDFNRCQQDRLRRLADKGARIIAVGDKNQAVYRFRGADNESYDRLREILSATNRGCEESRLPTNFRCGRAHLEYVRNNTIVHDIEAHDGAREGKIIEDLDYNGILDLLSA